MNPELQLRDIHLPVEVSWWPPAIGWWVVAALLLIALFLLFKRRRQTPAVSRRLVCEPALAELNRLEQEYADDPAQLIKEISVLLRRSAISLYGRHRVSGLSGAAWLAFLDQQSSRSEFDGRFHKMLTELPYREHSEVAAADLVTAVREWLVAQEQGNPHV